MDTNEREWLLGGRATPQPAFRNPPMPERAAKPDRAAERWGQKDDWALSSEKARTLESPNPSTPQLNPQSNGARGKGQGVGRWGWTPRFRIPHAPFEISNPKSLN